MTREQTFCKRISPDADLNSENKFTSSDDNEDTNQPQGAATGLEDVTSTTNGFTAPTQERIVITDSTDDDENDDEDVSDDDADDEYFAYKHYPGIQCWADP